MEEIITYLLKSSGLLAAFFLAYHFLLRKETFFTSNRWFLLSGLVTSALLPLFFIEKIVFVEKPKVSLDDLVVLSNNASEAIPDITAAAPTIDWMQIVAFGYGIIVVFLFLKLVFNLFSIVKLIRNKVVNKNESFSLIDINQDITPFSFFNYIVFNSTLYSKQELESILLHEKVHSKQKHSFDVVVAQLFTIIFWINPIVWLYKKAIIQNLEFIADSKAIQNIEDKKCYQLALLKVVSHQNCLPITNPFYQSLIKKRIVMLNKNQSNKRNSWKYAVVIPALIAFVLLFQIQVVAQEKLIQLSDGSSISTSTREVTEMYWTKNSPDKEFKDDIEALKNSDITMSFSDIKRNKKKEIIEITISYEDRIGNKDSKTFSKKNGIDPIYFKRDIDQEGKGEIGFYNSRNSKLLKNNNRINRDIDKNIDLDNIEQSKRDIEQSKRDIEQSKRDVEQSKLDIEQSKRDLEQSKLDIEQSKRDLEQSKIDLDQSRLFQEQNKKKIVIFSNDNGDDIVFIPSEKSLKLPGYPSVRLNDGGLVLIVNDVQKTNPLETLNQMNLQNVKSVRVYDENGKETRGTPINKIVITTK
jgi:hypothetical protein